MRGVPCLNIWVSSITSSNHKEWITQVFTGDHLFSLTFQILMYVFCWMLIYGFCFALPFHCLRCSLTFSDYFCQWICLAVHKCGTFKSWFWLLSSNLNYYAKSSVSILTFWDFDYARRNSVYFFVTNTCYDLADSIVILSRYELENCTGPPIITTSGGHHNHTKQAGRNDSNVVTSNNNKLY